MNPTQPTSPRLRALLTIGLLVVPFTLAAPALAGAGTPEDPEILYVPSVPNPTPAYVGHAAGYVWEELVGHAHVPVDVANLATTIPLASLPLGTILVDLEVSGLPAGLPDSTVYTLNGSGLDGASYRYMGAVNQDGRAVFWGVRPIPASLALVAPDGTFVAGVDFTPAPGPAIPQNAPADSSSSYFGPSRCNFSGDYGSCTFHCDAGAPIRITADDRQFGHFPRTHVQCGGIDVFCQDYQHCEATTEPTTFAEDGRCWSETVSNAGSCESLSSSSSGPRQDSKFQAEYAVPPHPETPKCYDGCPSRVETTRGETIQQAAIANNPNGKVTATGCYDHTFGASVKASGGFAARATAGGTYTYNQRRCDTITSTGPPTRSVRDDQFERMYYSDGSYRAYATATGNVLTVQNWNVVAYCVGGGTACFETVVTQDCKDFSRTLSERTSGTATVGGGWKVPGWSVEGELSITAASDSLVKFDITHPDCGTHTWHLGTLAGDHAVSGLIGILQAA